MDFVASFLLADWVGKPVWAWLGFLGIVAALIAFDLGVLNRAGRTMDVARSLWLSAFYVLAAVLFGIGVWYGMGARAGMEFFTGYLIEKSLSIDNVFVISLIFAAFAIPPRYQYRALVWGIVGAIVLRGVMIAAGASLVENFAWTLQIFAALLIVTGIKMLFAGEPPADVSASWPIRMSRRLVRVTPDLRGERFLVREPHPATGRPVLWATPLLVALVVINLADLIFAVDSVPAIFAITTDTYIVYTANIMAILGLRALYLALAAVVARFHYLRYALALVLVFIGGKVFAADLMGIDKVPAWLSLSVTGLTIAIGIGYSMWRTRPAAAG